MNILLMKDFFFNYIYFRLQKFYKKWDGDNGITAVIGVSMIQAIVFINIVLFILKALFTRHETHSYSTLLGYAGVFILVILIVINHYKFKDRYSDLELLWGEESERLRRIKGIAVLASLMIPWIVLISIALG